MKFSTYKQDFLLGADGKYHKVSHEIWLDYMHSIWKEEYAQKRDNSPIKRKKKGSATSASNETQYEEDSFPRIVSIDSITEAHGEAILPQSRSAETSALGKMNAKNVDRSLRKALATLPPEDKFIIQKLFEEGLSRRDLARETGKPHSTINNRTASILKSLRNYMEVDGITPDMVRDALEYER